MIPTYAIEDLSIAIADSLIEKGIVFDVTTNQTPILSGSASDEERESFWGARNKLSSDIPESLTK